MASARAAKAEPGPSPFSFAPDKATSAEDVVAPGSCPRFTDVHKSAGIGFVYERGSDGRNLMVESTGGGAGWLDIDADGVYDLYLVQGGNPAPPPGAIRPPDQLYRGRGDGTFAEVGASAGAESRGYGQGIAVGDYDGDGFDDFYVTNVGENVLYRSNGDGTFSDVTSAANAGDARWSTSAAWADLDSDGDLDLFLCNYAEYDPYHPLPCPNPDGSAGFCDPATVDACPNECFINQNDGTFLREARQRGLDPIDGNGKSLGVVIADFDLDGRP